MNRKAEDYIEGFTDLQWGLILIVLLIIFFVVISLQNQARAEKAVQEVGWEAQWMANSIAQHPVGEETVLSAMRSQEHDENLTALTTRILNQTYIGPGAKAWVVLVRKAEYVACAYQEEPGSDVTACADDPPPLDQLDANDAGDVIEGALQNRVDDLRGQPEQLRRSFISAGYPIGITHGPGNVYVGVIISYE